MMRRQPPGVQGEGAPVSATEFAQMLCGDAPPWLLLSLEMGRLLGAPLFCGSS